jgi:hypothetical protein
LPATSPGNDRDDRSPRSEPVSVDCRSAPPPFGSWRSFVERVAPLGDCSAMALDGIGFRHRLLTEGRTIDVRWSNPRPDEHPAQTAVLEAYAALLESAGLHAFTAGLR